MLVHRPGGGDDLDGRRVRPGVSRAAGIGNDGGQLGHQGTAMRRCAVDYCTRWVSSRSARRSEHDRLSTTASGAIRATPQRPSRRRHLKPGPRCRLHSQESSAGAFVASRLLPGPSTSPEQTTTSGDEPGQFAKCGAPFFSSRRPLPTTSRLAPMSANTAIHIDALPNTASPRNTALIPRARLMFCHSTACVA